MWVPERRRHGRRIVLAVLLVVAGLAVGGFLVATPVLREYPATLSTPPSVDGMPMLTDPTHRDLAARLRTQIAQSVPVDDVTAAFYAPDVDPSRGVLVVAGTHLLFRLSTQLDAAYRGLSVTRSASVDPGFMGGVAGCGLADPAGASMAICVWVDHGSIGVVVGYGRGIPETADLMRAIRPEILHR
jgi:hypothetical protein